MSSDQKSRTREINELFTSDKLCNADIAFNLRKLNEVFLRTVAV